MTTETELTTWIAALKKSRASGVRSVQHGDTRTEYKTDAEMAAALAALEAELAGVQGRGVLRQIRMTSEKGL